MEEIVELKPYFIVILSETKNLIQKLGGGDSSVAFAPSE